MDGPKPTDFQVGALKNLISIEGTILWRISGLPITLNSKSTKSWKCSIRGQTAEYITNQKFPIWTIVKIRKCHWPNHIKSRRINIPYKMAYVLSFSDFCL